MRIGALDPSGDGQDYTAFTILDITFRPKVIGVWRDKNLTLSERVQYINKAVNKYKVKQVIIEKNGVGFGYIDPLKEFVKTVPVTTTKKLKTKMTELICWHLENKQIDLSDVSHTPLIDELKTFGKLKDGKLGAITGHDDCVMSLGLGLLLANKIKSDCYTQSDDR